jgi:hypothetical protein
MDIQEILVYIVVAGAIAFLVKKFLFKKKKSGDCGSGDCGCH